MKNLLINTIIFILITAGSLLVGWHFIQADVINYLTQVPIVSEEFVYNRIYTEETAEFDWTAVSHMDFFDILGYIDDEVHPVGEIIIPTLDVRLPVLIGSSDLNMTLGAGTVRPGMVMGQGNFVLGSHWDASPNVRFGGIHLLELGDLLILRDAEYLYLYEVIIANELIGQHRVDIVDDVEGKIYLTLFTCTSAAHSPYRIKVRGELIEQISIAELQASYDLVAEFENLSPVINVEVLVEVIETLEYPEIPFPTQSVVIVVVIALTAATGVVWLSGKDFKKKNHKEEINHDQKIDDSRPRTTDEPDTTTSID